SAFLRRLSDVHFLDCSIVMLVLYISSRVFVSFLVFFFFFNDTATTEIYTLSLHDALPISRVGTLGRARPRGGEPAQHALERARRDRKSTRLNSSHVSISYAVFCLKKKK